MFKTGHALPLAGARLLRPRSSRGEHAEHPREVSGSWPQTRQIRDLYPAGNKTRTQTVRVREQSMSTFSPRKQARPRTGRVLGNAAASIVRESAAATDSNCPQPVRSRELSTSANWSRAQSVREHGPATNCPRRCIAVSILPRSISRFASKQFPPMTSFDPATVRQAVAEFTPLRPQKFQDLLPARHCRTAHATLPADEQDGHRHLLGTAVSIRVGSLIEAIQQ
jgi:hypothetical protein